MQVNDPSDCKRFIKCANNIPYFQDCPSFDTGTLHYDPYMCRCDWPDQARCLINVTTAWCDGCRSLDNKMVEFNDDKMKPVHLG